MLKFSCPKCGRRSIYTRTNGIVRCSVCGYEGKREEFFHEEDSKKGKTKKTV